MFVKVPQRSSLIRVDDDYAHLADVANDTGDMTFTFTYHVNQSDIIRTQYLRVRVTTYTKNIKKVTILQDREGNKAVRQQIPLNILRHVTDYKTAIQNNKVNLISHDISDATAKVNNTVIAPLRRGLAPSSLAILNKTNLVTKTVRDLNLDNEEHPILQSTAHVDNGFVPTQTLKNSIQSMIIHESTDPSHVTNQLAQRTTALQASRGLAVPLTRFRFNNINTTRGWSTFLRLVNPVELVPKTTFQVTEDQVVQLMQTVPKDEVDVPVSIFLQRSKVVSDKDITRQVFVKFELVNRCNVTVNTIVKNLDIQKHLRIFRTPKTPPLVKFARYDTLSKGSMQVAQTDDRAQSVKLFQKQFSHVVNQSDTYQLLGEYSITPSDGFVTIPVDLSKKSTAIFRAISVGENDTNSFEFTNIIVNPNIRPLKLRFASLVSKIVSTGIQLEVSEIPCDIVSFVILRKDRTIFDTDFSNVGDDVVQVEATKDNKTYVVVDTEVKTGHVYEYICRMIYVDGSYSDVQSTLVEYAPLTENLVSTRIDNLQIVNDINNLDVQFDITSVVNETNMDTIKNLLERQGIAQFFSDDVLRQRDELQNLVAHQVYRIDLTAGVRENFGVVASGSFSDANLRAVNSVKPLVLGKKYRYEVTTLLRAPETMFEQFQKSAVDKTTKKAYTFYPAKFLHPLALGRGNIVERDTQLAHYAKLDMSFGNIGDLITAEVSFAEDSNVITNQQAVRFDIPQVIVSWQLTGPASFVDHFLIILSDNNIRHPLGKVHLNEVKTSFEYIHVLTPDDVGQISYLIVPVFNNYIVGQEVETNKITI